VRFRGKPRVEIAARDAMNAQPPAGRAGVGFSRVR
jgi:hypothetical protein